MINKKSLTGQLQDSKIPNCPVFKPEKISKKVYSRFEIKEGIKAVDSISFVGIEKIIQPYLLKFLSGDKNTKSGFADVAVEELFLWKEVKIGKNVFVKNVFNSIKRFEQELMALDKQDELTVKFLIQINKNLRPKEKRFGLRDCGMKVGNPSLNPDAFYALPPEHINEYLQDLVDYINNNNNPTDLNKALFLNLYFIFIHPFYDGNGRVSRLLFLNQLKENRTSVMMVLLYLKTIDSFAYHNAMNLYRQGKTDILKNFHTQAINWTNQSIQVLSGFIEEYSQKVGQNKIDTEEDYSQVVIKAEITQEIDKSIFKFHSKKAGKHIYINTALLNVLNQFDYYLRYELRKHQSN